MDGGRDVGEREPLLFRKDELLENQARPFTYDRRPKDLSGRRGHDFREPVSAAVNPRTIEFGVLRAKHQHLRIDCPCGRFRDSHGGHSGVGERCRGQCLVIDFLGQPENRVLERDGGLSLGRVGKFIPMGYVANRQDALGVGLKIVVDFDAMPRVSMNADGLQVQSFGRWPAALAPQ